MATKKQVLKAQTSAELLSYIINVTPELREIDLPVQGQDIRPIGQLILSNERYKNAFLNTVNIIGLTFIDRNYWENPWENFANRGQLRIGQTVREIIVDIANVYDYNEFVNNPTHFLENVVPNVYQYLHEINFQKFYKTTTSDEQMAMAFESEDGLFNLIETIIGSLYEGYKYDKYITDKYQLVRRILSGTITSIQIPNYNAMTPRERVSFMKNISNKMSFRSPNYNPAGVRKATSFDNQILIMNTEFDSTMSTEVLATSYFTNEAEFKTKMALIDSFWEHDTARLTELLGDAFIPFSEEEISQLKNIPAVIVGEDFFQDYYYALNNANEANESNLKQTEFFNPETLRRNHWLHAWLVLSTSPFENAVVFTTQKPSVDSIALSPQEMTISAGNNVQLTPTVNTTGFANKAVTYSVTKAEGAVTPVTVSSTGLVKIPSDFPSTGQAPQIEITATSIYDNTKTATASITVL